MPRNLILVLAVLLTAWCGLVRAGQPAWLYDADLGFHFALLDSEEPVADTDRKAAEPLAVGPNSAPWAADITNIDLDGIRNLGFPLPARPGPGSFTLYLKFFAYPAWLSTRVAVEQAVEGYGLDLLPDHLKLRAWLLRRDHLRIKKAFIAPTGRVFSAADPYPPLVLPCRNIRNGDASMSPETYLTRVVPFLSLYLNPAEPEPAGLTEDERAAWSGRGVIAFHKALLAAYERTFETLSGPDNDKFAYFRMPAVAGTKTLTILKIPRVPLTFEKTWRDLPMPQNPRKVFLSALLLIFRSEYEVTGTLAAGAVVDSPEFGAATKLLRAQVFEAGSVVRQP